MGDAGAITGSGSTARPKVEVLESASVKVGRTSTEVVEMVEVALG